MYGGKTKPAKSETEGTARRNLTSASSLRETASCLQTEETNSVWSYEISQGQEGEEGGGRRKEQEQREDKETEAGETKKQKKRKKKKRSRKRPVTVCSLCAFRYHLFLPSLILCLLLVSYIIPESSPGRSEVESDTSIERRFSLSANYCLPAVAAPQGKLAMKKRGQQAAGDDDPAKKAKEADEGRSASSAPPRYAFFFSSFSSFSLPCVIERI